MTTPQTLYKEDEDYQLVIVREDTRPSVKLLIEGKYEGVIFTYGRVSIKDGEYTMRFLYEIEDPVNHTKEQLTEDKEFENLLGEILADIIIESGNTKKYERKYSNPNTEDSNPK